MLELTRSARRSNPSSGNVRWMPGVDPWRGRGGWSGGLGGFFYIPRSQGCAAEQQRDLSRRLLGDSEGDGEQSGFGVAAGRGAVDQASRLKVQLERGAGPREYKSTGTNHIRILI